MEKQLQVWALKKNIRSVLLDTLAATRDDPKVLIVAL